MVSEKIGPEKMYWYRYQKYLVLEKSTGTSTGKKLVLEKVAVLEKILSTVTLWLTVH